MKVANMLIHLNALYTKYAIKELLVGIYETRSTSVTKTMIKP